MLAREKSISELKSRISHMIYKLLKLMDREERTLFLAKVRNEGDEQNCEYARSLVTVLNKLYKSKNYKIVLIFEAAARSDALDRCEDEHLAVRYVSRFADDSKTDTDSDWEGWLSIFKEYDTCDEKKYYERIQRRINNER